MSGQVVYVTTSGQPDRGFELGVMPKVKPFLAIFAYRDRDARHPNPAMNGSHRKSTKGSTTIRKNTT